MSAYYNEHDPFAAAWLRELIGDGLIAPGDVDERDIQQVQRDDLRGYTQCHFFAGIGGWSGALRLAGWPDSRHVWTGSCPCQPLSSAGQRKGHADERHLWPALHRLISECRPAIVFGEQVAGALGYEWLAGIRADLESGGYAVGAADLCAASVGAPHIRQRIYWLADATREFRYGGEVDRIRRENGAKQTRKHRGQGFDILPLGSDWALFEPSICIEDDGVSNRMETMRGAGNAIVPQIAAQFIGAWMDLQ